MPTPLTQPIIKSFHSRAPLRIGSLIVTIFGDAVLPHGAFVPLSKLLNITSAIGIDDGAVRVAMHRLEKDGWLKKQKVGRNAHYALSKIAKLQSKAAAERIYAFEQPEVTANLRLLILAEGPARAKTRDRLVESGWGAIAPNLLLTSGLKEQSSALGTLSSMADHIIVPVEPNGSDTGRLCARAWPLDSLNEDYAAFVELYQPLLQWNKKTGEHGREDALVLRTLLVHDYRRLILKDPFLPAPCLPDNWQGTAAHKIMSSVYGNLRGRSELWMAG